MQLTDRVSSSKISSNVSSGIRKGWKPKASCMAIATAATVTGMSLFSTPAASGATITWNGSSTNELGTAANWVGSVLPNPATPDTAQFNNIQTGALNVVYTTTTLAGSSGNSGISLDVTANQISSLNLDSGSNISALRLNNITIASSAGAFSLGNSANTFNITWGGATGTRTLTNNSVNTATINSDVVNGNGGAGVTTFAFAGSGNWNINNNLNSTNNGANIVTKSGTGTVTLAGANTYTGLTTVTAGTLNVTGSIGTGDINVQGGTFNISGSTGTNSNATSGFKVGTATNTAAVMNIQSGAVITNRANLFVGDAGAGTGGGAVYQSGGIFTLTQGASADNLRIGSNAGGYGYYKLSGGALTANEFGIGASLSGTIGVMDVTSGTATSNGYITLGRGGTTSSGVLNVTGGAVVFGASAGSQLAINWAGTSGAESVVNVGGGAGAATITGPSTATVSRGLNLANANVSGTNGIANLLTNGTLNVSEVTASNTNPTVHLNFNGGTLKATAANAGSSFLINSNIDAVNVYSNGGTLDNNGTSITVSRPLAAPAGFGITSTTVSVPSGGSGYIGAPQVRITGGTGTGATGYATMSGGVVTGIVITSPGIGYTTGNTLTATFFGGGASTAATTVTGITVASNTSGGMAYAGSGTTTLSGANTYSGTSSLTGGGKLIVTGSLASSALTVTNGSLDSTTTMGAITVANNAANVISNGNGGTTAISTPSLAFNGAATVNIRSAGAAGIVVSGGLSTTPANGQVTINPFNSLWSNGLNNLISYGSFSGSASNFTLGTVTGALTSRQTVGSLALNGNNLALNIIGDTPYWTGGVNDQWTLAAIGGAQNWKLVTAGTGTEYLANDAVLFNDNALANTDVKINAASVSPSGTIFNNTTKNYTIGSTGGFGIAGTGLLTKNGTGTLAINTSNSYTGATALNAGTTSLNGSLTGTAITVASSATLLENAGGLINNSPITVASGASFTQNVLGTISGTGTFSNSGSSTLAGTNTYSGATAANAGTLNMNGSLSGSSVTVASGATFTESSAGGISGAGTFTNSGTTNLGGTNTYTGTTTVTNGTLNLTGTINSGSAAGLLNINPATGTTAIMNSSGTVLVGAGNSTVGSVAGGTGVLNVTGGSFTTGGTSSQRDLQAGSSGFGVINASAGNVNIGGYLVAGIGSSGAVGIWNINGANVTILSSQNFSGTVGASTSTTGLINLTSGSFNSTGPFGAHGIMIGENGAGILNVSGSGNMNLGGGVALGRGLVIGQNSTAAGIVNLGAVGSGGGTITTNIVQKIATAATGVLDFHGGTLKAQATNTTSATFLTGLTNTYVYSEGGTIDNNGVGITIGQALLAPTGSGVTSIAFTGGTGYVATPFVSISGGGGTGATANATIDNSGNITGIVITNPGVGYTSAPSVSFTGGGGTVPTIGSVTTAANVSGGLNFAGSGTTTLSGASTFTGDLNINGGTLVASLTNNINNATSSALGNPQVARNIYVNAGTTLQLTGADVLGSATTNVLATVVIAQGATVTNGGNNFNTFGPLTINGGTLTTTGGAVTAYQSYNLLGNVTVGGTVASTISGTGTNNGIHLNTATVFNVADATSSSAVDLAVSAPLIDRNGSLGGSGGLTKSGNGTMQITSVSTYSGPTTINAGVLSINGSIANSAVTVVGGKLQGNGTTGGVTVQVAGTIAPGNSIGTLNTGTITIAGTYLADIDTSSAGPVNFSSDLLSITGSLFLDPTTSALVLNEFGTDTILANGSKFTLATYTVAWDGTSIFAGMGDNSTFSFGSNSYQIDYNDPSVNSGNALTLTVVPEPTTLGLLAVGTMGLLRRRRR